MKEEVIENLEADAVYLLKDDCLKYVKMEACEEHLIALDLLQRIRASLSCQNHVIKKASHLSD